MEIKIQLYSFIVSFCYGLFIYLIFNLNKKKLVIDKIMVKFTLSFVLIVDIVLLYVAIMYKLNNGIIHNYFVIVMIFGYVLGKTIVKKLKKRCKKIKTIL